MENGIRDTIERNREKGRIFLNNFTKAFIKDIYDNIHFCYIKEVYSDWVIIEGFSGKRAGEIIRIYWTDIKLFEEYEDERK